MELREYQKRMVFRIEKEKNLILSVGMGLGKTAAVLFAINNKKPARVIIVGTKRIAETVWKQEAEAWGLTEISDKMIIVSGTAKQKKSAILNNSKPYKIICRDSLQYLSFLGNDEGTWLILDELTSFKNIYTSRCKNVCAVKAEKKIGLTGTFAANGMLDLFGQAAAVGLYSVTYRRIGKKEYSPEFTAWRGKYFVNANEGSGLAFPRYKLITKMENVVNEIKDNVFTLDSNDYLQIPTVSFFKHSIILNDETQKAYLQASTMLSVNLQNETISFDEGAKFMKLQTICNGFIYEKNGIPARAAKSEKLEQVADFCESIAAENEKVLLFYAHREESIWLQELLNERKISYCTVKDKNFIEKWNGGEVDVLLANPASAGHGLNLQHGGHIIVWSSITYNFEFWAQANARLARTGQKKPVQIHVFQCKDTVEEAQYRAVTKKEKDNNEFIQLTK